MGTADVQLTEAAHVPQVERVYRPECEEGADRVLIHPGSSVAQPDVFVICRDGSKCLLKDYSVRPFAIRLLFGRGILRHEYNILRRLDGVEGVPRAVDMPDADRLLIEYIEGPGPLGDTKETPPGGYPPVAFFEELRSVVEQMHACGISHGDIRRRNVLCREDGRPFLVDFATALDASALWFRFWGKPLFRTLAKCDTISALKLQRSYHPDSLSPDEEHMLDHPPWFLRIGRFLRKRVYRRFVKQRTWRRRLAALKGTRLGSTDS